MVIIGTYLYIKKHQFSNWRTFNITAWLWLHLVNMWTMMTSLIVYT